MNTQKLIAIIVAGIMLAVWLNGSTIYIKNGDIIQLPGKGGSLLYKSGSVPTTTTTTNPYWTDPNQASLGARFRYDPTVTNTIGQSEDSSGFNRHASAPVAVTWEEAGTNQYGRIKHDFDTGGTGYLTNNATFASGCTSILFTAWVNCTSKGDFKGIIFSPDAGNAWGGLLDRITGYTFYLSRASGAYQSAAMGGETETGVWKFLAGYWTSGDKLYLFLNGTNTAESAVTSSADTYFVSNFEYGRYGSGYNFNGKIAHAQVYTNLAWSLPDLSNFLATVQANTLPTNSLEVQ